MDALGLSLIGLAFTLITGSYGYTFLIQRDSSKERKTLKDHVDELDHAWTRTADDMRKARDLQVSELKSDTQQAISELTVRHYDYKLQVQREFATVRSVEQVEANLIAAIGKVESTLGRQLDKLTEMVKNGAHK